MLSRILRNNDFIRIFAICQICILIFTVPVFASPPTQDVDDVIQRTNNFTVWTDYTQNFSIYYGDHIVNYSEALLNSIAQTLKYDGEEGSYHIISNSDSNGMTRRYYIAGFLADVTWNQWQINQTLKSLNSSINGVGNDVSYLNTAMNNALYDYQHLGQSAFSVGTTSRNTAVNTSNIYNELHNINWEKNNYQSFQSLATDFNQSNTISRSSTVLSPGTYYLKLNNIPYSDQKDFADIYQYRIPIRPASVYLLSNYDFIRDVTVYRSNGNVYLGDWYLNLNTSKEGQYFTNFTFYNYIPPHNDYLIIKMTINQNWVFTTDFTDTYIYTLSSNTHDYYTVLNAHQMNDLLNKDFTANIDGSDLEININDSINVTPIELDVQIGIDDFTAVNTVSNKLRSWLSTGVGVVDLIAALDQLDDTFFTLHNCSVIETISTGYTDYYD